MISYEPCIVYNTPTKMFNIIYLTDIIYADEVIQNQLPKDVIRYKLINGITDMPNNDVDFYKAWEFTDNYVVQVNMSAARDLIREKLRNIRDAKFAPLDVAFMRAVEQGNVAKQQEIAAQKQKLRDITVHPAIDAATTLEELRELTIDKLLSLSIT